MGKTCSLNVKPKNKLYLTNNDFPSWNDYFGNLMQNDVGRKYLEDMKVKYGEEEIVREGQLDLLAKNITLVVTERCNLRCTYCYEEHEFHRNGRIMTKEIGRQIIDTLFDEEKMKGYFKTRLSPGIVLEFIGGEPLLEIDLIDYLIDYFRKKAFEMNHPWAFYHVFSISTNGVLYNTKKVQEFIRKNDDLSMTITLDGNKKLHDSCRVFPDGSGSYDIVEQSMKKGIQEGYIRQTKLTLAPGNVKHTFEAIKNLMDLGLQEVYANCVYEEGWNLDHAKILYSELIKLSDYIIDNELYTKHYISLFEESIGGPLTEDRNYCGGNGAMLAFDPDGIAYPCLRFMSHSMSTKREPIVVGDINTKIGENESGALEHLRSITMISQSDEKCINCKIPSGCGVCSGLQYDLFGDSNIRATYICVMHQARVLANHYYFKKLYSKLGLIKNKELNIPKEWALNIIDEKEYNYLINIS